MTNLEDRAITYLLIIVGFLAALGLVIIVTMGIQVLWYMWTGYKVEWLR